MQNQRVIRGGQREMDFSMCFPYPERIQPRWPAMRRTAVVAQHLSGGAPIQSTASRGPTPYKSLPAAHTKHCQPPRQITAGVRANSTARQMAEEVVYAQVGAAPRAKHCQPPRQIAASLPYVQSTAVSPIQIIMKHCQPLRPITASLSDQSLPASQTKHSLRRLRPSRTGRWRR